MECFWCSIPLLLRNTVLFRAVKKKNWKVYAGVVKQKETNKETKSKKVLFGEDFQISILWGFLTFKNQHTPFVYVFVYDMYNENKFQTDSYSNHHCNTLQCIISSHGRWKLKKNIFLTRREFPRILFPAIIGFANAVSLWSGDFLLPKLFALQTGNSGYVDF